MTIASKFYHLTALFVCIAINFGQTGTQLGA